MSYIAKNGRLYTSGASEALTLLDDKFSVNKSYSKGDSCIYNDYLWKFTSDKPAGEWDSSVVEQCRIMDFVDDINGHLNDKVGKAWAYSSGPDALSHVLDGTPKLIICSVVYTISNIQHISSITIAIRGTETGSSRFVAGGANVHVQLDINWDAKTYTTLEMYNGQTVPTNRVIWDYR